MLDIKACLVCFSTDVKLSSMDNNQLREQYSLLTGLQLQKCNGMPDYLCYQCCGYVMKFIKFRDKCHRAYFILDLLLQKDEEITKSRLEAIDCDSVNIKPFLTYCTKANFHYEQQHFKEVNVILHDISNSMYVSNPQDISNGGLVKGGDQSEDEEKTTLMETDDEDNNAQCSSFNEYDTEVFVSDDTDDDDCLKSESDDNENISLQLESQDQPPNSPNKSQEGDGSVLETEYATMHILSKNEAQAAQAILNTKGSGKHICSGCERRFMTEDHLKKHLHKHDPLTANGRYYCDICNYYYTNNYNLKKHMTEIHTYKYICKKCPEVSFHRSTAKQHFVNHHLRKNNAKPWDLVRPSWLMARSRKNGGPAPRKKLPGVPAPRKKLQEPAKLPADIICTPVTQEEQYARIQDRNNAKKKFQYRCDQCFKEHREMKFHLKHMKQHDPSISGDLQCDMCKLYFKRKNQIRQHMASTHVYKFSCRLCDHVCISRDKAVLHYKFHKNVTYKCPHCPLEFTRLMSRINHVRRWHPSTFICNLCGHSFVGKLGLKNHQVKSHTEEEVKANSQTPVDKTSTLYCAECEIQFVSDAAFETHLGSSKKHVNVYASEFKRRPQDDRDMVAGNPPRPRRRTQPRKPTPSNCEICNKVLPNEQQVRKHYAAEHPGKRLPKRHMCEVCGLTTDIYANLKNHMRMHTNEKPFQCPQCDRRFRWNNNLKRHISLVHTTQEKRYECHICQKRFTTKSAVKIHIQVIHMKIPYAPWNKKYRKLRSDLKHSLLSTNKES